MRRSGDGSSRWLAGWVACCVTVIGAVGCLVGAPAVVSAAGSSQTSAQTSSPASAGGSGASLSLLGGGGASASLRGPLVVHGGLEEAQQAQAAERARLASPEAVLARKESSTKFEHLNTNQAVKVAGEAFPGVVDAAAGGPPRLPSGDRIVGYVAENAAAVTLPDGRHGAIESLGPIATPSGHGHFTPINLGLRSGGDGYVPANSDVAVQ
jgi:hypothetical protein